MKNLKFFLKLLKGSSIAYFSAILLLLGSVLTGIFEPLILKTAVDFCINGFIVNDNSFANMILPYINREFSFGLVLLILALALVLINIVTSVLAFLKDVLSSVCAQRVGKKLRDKVFEHIQDVNVSELLEVKKGDWVQRCTSDVETIVTFLEIYFVEILRVFALVIFVGVSIFLLNVRLAVAGTFLIPVMIGFSVYFFNRINRIFTKYDEAEGELMNHVGEYVNGIRTLKSFGKDELEFEKFDEVNKDARNKLQKLIDLFAYYWSFSNLLSHIQTLTVLIYGSILVVRGDTTIGTITAFIGYGIMLNFPIQQLGRILAEASKSMVAIKRIREILETSKESYDDGELSEITGGILFEKVGFYYNDKRAVLEDISFSVKKGETVGIIGATGAGKSTLVNLLVGMYKPTCGKIYIGDSLIENINKKWLRDNVGIVSQEAFLFSRKVSENIIMSNEQATQKQINMAYKNSDFVNVLSKLSHGEDTLLGEKGVNLSGGQRQRLNLARTIVKDYPILVLDDCASALDAHTEREVRENIKGIRKGKTTFIISHRISSVWDCDKILVMDKGNIVECGNHSELIEKEKLYYNLCYLQDKLKDKERGDILWGQRKTKKQQGLTLGFGEKCLGTLESLKIKS